MIKPKITAQAQAQAQAIDTNKDKIYYAGAALLMGLLAAAFYSSNAKAQTPTTKLNPVQEINHTYEYNSQKLNH